MLWNLRQNQLRVAVIELAKYLTVPGHSTIPLNYTFARYRRYERHVTEVYGWLTKAKLGIAPHAFRRSFLSCRVETVSHVIRPLRRQLELNADEVVRDRVGRQIAALDAGDHDLYTAGA